VQTLRELALEQFEAKPNFPVILLLPRSCGMILEIATIAFMRVKE
jgi:hypothetical protein